MAKAPVYVTKTEFNAHKKEVLKLVKESMKSVKNSEKKPASKKTVSKKKSEAIS